jgi:hypothetical protein
MIVFFFDFPTVNPRIRAAIDSKGAFGQFFPLILSAVASKKIEPRTILRALWV